MSTLIEIVVTTLLSLLLTTGGKQETEVSDKVQPEFLQFRSPKIVEISESK